MSKTKYIKVPVSERLPEKEGKYFTLNLDVNVKKELTEFKENRWWVPDDIVPQIKYWLLEVPDLEGEMREILETILKMHNHGEFISPYEIDKIKDLLTN